MFNRPKKMTVLTCYKVDDIFKRSQEVRALWLKIDRNTFPYTGMDLGISSDGIKFWNSRITHS